MNRKSLIFMTIAITALGIICFSLFFLFQSKVSIIVYNPVKQTSEIIKVKQNSLIFDSIYNGDQNIYNYYYDQNFNNVVEKNHRVNNTVKIIVGEILESSSTDQLADNYVGVKYLGDVTSDCFDILTQKYKYLDLSKSQSFSAENNAINYTVNKLILPDNLNIIKDLNNFIALQEVYFSAVQVDNSFNNCPNLSTVICNSQTVKNSFSNCKDIAEFVIQSNTKSLENCFAGTRISQFSNNSENFIFKNNILYQISGNNCILVKATKNIESVDILSNTVSISDYAFYKCESIKNIELNSKVTQIGKYSFKESSLQNFNIIQTNILQIQDSAFENCYNLKTFSFGIGVNFIGDKVFYNCSSLEQADLSFSDNLSVGKYAFAYCKNLSTVKFSNSVSSLVTLGDGTFYNCKNLETVENLNTTAISEYCFFECNNLRNVSINKLEIINNYAFKGCESLETIAFAQNATNVGIAAFSGCKKISNVSFYNLTEINKYSFAYCSSLETFIASQATVLKQNAFLNCSVLNTVTLTGDMTLFESEAFTNCNELKKLVVQGNKYICEDKVLYQIENTSKIKICYYMPSRTQDTYTIPDTVNQVENIWLSGNKYLKNIICNSEYFYSDDGVLFSADKTKLIAYPAAKTNNEYTIPTFVTTLLSNSFCNTINLNDLTIGESVLDIEYGFICQNCTLTTLTTQFIGKSKENLESAYLGWFFGSENNLENNNIPDSLQVVAVISQKLFSDGAFSNCNNLKEIHLQAATKVSSHMFYKCLKLTTIKLNAAVENISNYAFYNCNSLKQLYVGYFADISLGISALLGMPKNLSFYSVSNQNIDPDSILAYKRVFTNVLSDIKWTWFFNI